MKDPTQKPASGDPLDDDGYRGRYSGPGPDSTKRRPTAKPEQPSDTVKANLTPSEPYDQVLRELIRTSTRPAPQRKLVTVERYETSDCLLKQIWRALPKALGIGIIVGVLTTAGFVMANPIVIESALWSLVASSK